MLLPRTTSITELGKKLQVAHYLQFNTSNGFHVQLEESCRVMVTELFRIIQRRVTVLNKRGNQYESMVITKSHNENEIVAANSNCKIIYKTKNMQSKDQKETHRDTTRQINESNPIQRKQQWPTADVASQHELCP